MTEARPNDFRRRLRRRWFLWVALGVVALAIVLSAISGFYIDILWFREVGHSGVFWTRFWSRLLLGVAFGAVFALIMYANLLIVRAIRPRYRIYSPEEEVVERYRTVFEPYAAWALPVASVVFGVFAAGGAVAQWERFQLWRVAGRVSFGMIEPVFERDASFYVLSLPFLEFVQSWLFASLVAITVITAGAHYLWGGIRLRAPGERVSPQVKAHLSVLLGLIVLVQAWGYWLGRFGLLLSPRGTVTGASYTDVNAQLPALTALVLIAVLSGALFLVNIRLRGWALPIAAVGILIVASIVIGAVVPAFVQRFRVDPQEPQLEREFIERNIEFTRFAYSIHDVERQSFAAGREVTAEELEEAATTVENIRLWNPDVLRDSYQQLQRIRPYYEFRDVDVDRYEIDGERRLTMITPREVNQDGIPGGGQTWQNEHLFYTHGFGGAASRVDQVTSEGAPAFVLANIPPRGELDENLAQPRVYFQEESAVPYLVVGADTDELDFPVGEQGPQQLTRYDGTGGIDIGGFVRKLTFAWRYRDVNLLISNLITEDSRILVNIDLPTRVQKVAPFLRYDADPYAAIVDGRFVWIWDAYTTSNTFPYSERVFVDVGTPGGLDEQLNYLRNSVKVMVDAYDGTITFYVVDEEDPVIMAWNEVFPDLFTSLDEASEDLRAHFRYPEDLFRVQAHQYSNYHVTDPRQFYAKEDFWSVPVVARDPQGQATDLEPYYVLTTLPGEDEARFLLFIPFVPADRPNMVAWMAASGDPETYGQLMSFEFQAENVTGPAQAVALISNDTDISREVSLFNQLGSRVIYGDILAMPIGDSFLYVQPLYLRSEQQATAIPEMKRVVVVNGNRVTMAESLESALTLSVGEAPEEEEEEEPPDAVTPPEVPGDVAEILEEAQEHFLAAEEALRRGNLAEYQREVEAARAAIEEALGAAAVPGG